VKLGTGLNWHIVPVAVLVKYVMKLGSYFREGDFLE
jgi:hypothetical protein